MTALILSALLAVGAYLLKSRYQRQRIALLGSHLGKYPIEKLMTDLTTGYMRALGEADAVRQDQIWSLLTTAETQLSSQFNRFATAFSQTDEAATRVSQLAFPYADHLFPSASFDLRKLFRIHAQGLADAAANPAQRSPKNKAFVLLAEMMLMQHTCHWFCRSKTVASARLLGHHHTSYAQVLESVAPETRKAYLAIVGHAAS